jgi:hypothetical protein
MSDETKPQDSAAMPPASVGSQPVAWEVVHAEPGLVITRERRMDDRLRLTDKERKALEGMLNTIMYEPDKIAVKSILSRFG